MQSKRFNHFQGNANVRRASRAATARTLANGGATASAAPTAATAFTQSLKGAIPSTENVFANQATKVIRDLLLEIFYKSNYF